MLISMTGYVSKNQQLALSKAGALNLTIELKSLNGRFFEVVSKLPSSFNHLEVPIAALLQEKLVRGRVYLNIKLQDVNAQLTHITPAWALIDQYMQAADAMHKRYNVAAELSVKDLMHLPDVLVAEENVLVPDDEKAILECIAQAADAVMRMRKEEGLRLEKDFEKIFEKSAQKLDQIKQAFSQESEKLKEKLKDLMAAAQPASGSISEVDEMQNSLRRMDIHEEITRFASHLASVKPLLAAPDYEKGKRLDFIFQELFRETNTMMAKCPAFGIGAAGIDIKVGLEKAREQVQNIL